MFIFEFSFFLILFHIIILQEMSESEYRSSISVRPTFNRTLHSQSTATYGSTICKWKISLKIFNLIAFKLPALAALLKSLRSVVPLWPLDYPHLEDMLLLLSVSLALVKRRRWASWTIVLPATLRKSVFWRPRTVKWKKILTCSVESGDTTLPASKLCLRLNWEWVIKWCCSILCILFQSAKELISDSDKERAQLEDQIRKLTEELNNYRNKLHEAERGHDMTRKELDDVLGRLGALESEIELIKRRITLMEDSVGYLKRENHRMLGELQHARNVREVWEGLTKSGVFISGSWTRNFESYWLPEPSSNSRGGVWLHQKNPWFC